MIIKYRLTTPENDDFYLDIEMFDENTFLDFHFAIIEACKFDNQVITTFYLSDENWDFQDEIIFTRFDEVLKAEMPLMEETRLSFFNPVKGQRYLYVFDEIHQRGFFIEIISVRDLKKTETKDNFPKFNIKGIPPQQFDLEFEEDELRNDFENDFDDDDFEEDLFGDDFGGDFSNNYSDDY
ncbi:MAG: hypothetical protein LBV69_07990 [Bacteroidales bacterium]|jgi:hypothetical protein|nr:hypothetical protein [Bacteroidales bacterium]